MAKVVKKKKKKLGAGRPGGGPATRETSNLRPQFVPKRPPCMSTCPNHVPIRKALMTIAKTEDMGRTYDESFEQAWEIVTERNPIPSVCGRVCPHPCEGECNRNHIDGAVNINKLERFIGDYAIEKGLKFKKITDETRNEKIAVIGSGPAGLSCAYQLARRGYPVTMFEAFSKPGGMLRYGIPSYRLPEDVLDAEVNRILDLGVELKTNTMVGKDVSYDDLRNEYNVIFVAIGAHKGLPLRIEGEDAPNVYTGAQFLNLVNSGERIDVGKKVVVIGGGDSAVDAARVSKRLGADVTILYRRTINEMPAIKEEVEEAEREGIKMEFLAAPIEILRNNGSEATGMKCIRMELGEPDASGRRRPVPIDGSEFEVETDTIIAAISQEPNFEGFENLREGRDWIKTDEYGKTKMENTFAGGDAIELGLVTVANFHGRRAAMMIHSQLSGLPFEGDKQMELPLITHDKMKLDYYERKDRTDAPTLPIEERFGPDGLEKETTLPLSREQAIEESKRCLSCGMCFDCGTCWSFCQDNAIVKPDKKGELYSFKLEFCQGCKKCAEECPCGFIEMH